MTGVMLILRAMSSSDAYWTISNYPDPLEELVDNAGCGTIHYHQFGDCHVDECFREDLFVRSGNVRQAFH